jgi:ribosomal protein S19E (S16A)
VVYLISESNDFNFSEAYNFEQLHYFSEVVNNTIEHLPFLSRQRIITFVKLNFENLSKKCRKELSSNHHFSFLCEIDKSKNEVSSEQETLDNTTPSSPPPTSSLINTLNYRDNTLITYAKLSLQTCDAIVIKNCISKYNFSINSQNTTKNTSSMRYFWPDWQKVTLKLQNLNIPIETQLINSTVISSLVKSNSPNDMDFFFISYAKVIQLIELKKFDCANRLIKAFESVLNNNAKSSKTIMNQILYLSINKFLSEFDSIGLDESLAKNKEQILKNCRSFLIETKKDNGSILSL